jgi:hypothetical protein
MGNFRYAYVVLQIVASIPWARKVILTQQVKINRSLTGSLEKSGSLDARRAARAK